MVVAVLEQEALLGQGVADLRQPMQMEQLEQQIEAVVVELEALELRLLELVQVAMADLV
jgi:hypothetical protein